MSTFNIAFQPAEGAKEFVANLLKSIDYNINYQGYFANHLCHGLYALYALGASKSRLQEYYDFYVQKLEPLKKPDFTMNSTNWNENIGNKMFYSEFLQYFDDELTSKGLKSMFDLYIDKLLGESLGAVLHPLIHIGYGMEFSNPHLLSEGFAYACIFPLNNTNDIFDDIDSIDVSGGATVLNIIEELQGIQFPEFPGNFHEKSNLLVESNGTTFRRLIAKWDLTQIDDMTAKLNELTETSILAVFATYLKQIDFYLLHVLTGNHAVRIIFPYLSLATQRQILRVNLLGLLIFYVIQRQPKLDVTFITGYKESEPDESISWNKIVKMAIAVDEEHVPKVVRSVIHYVETVPMSQRSALFSEQFLKRCAFKAVDILRGFDDFFYDGPPVKKLD